MRSLLAYANLAIGSFITAQVMTFTKGSVGILFSSPRLKMPENISQIPALLPPILALVYNCTLIVKETAQLLKDESTQINLDPFESSDYFFPNSFVQWYPDIRDWWVGPKVSLILKRLLYRSLLNGETTVLESKDS